MLMFRVALMVMLCLGLAVARNAASEMAGARTFEGDVLKMEDDFYTVHDTAGHEVRVHVDKSTQMDGTFKTGDKVKVQVTDKGHALSLTHVSVKGGGMAALGPQTFRGDLLKIEGESYTVHDTSGHEVRVHVDRTTKLDGVFKTGDKIEVEVSEQGHAVSIKHVM